MVKAKRIILDLRDQRLDVPVRKNERRKKKVDESKKVT
jgi:hypothetical protein